ILITGHYANFEDSDDVLLKNFDKMLKLTGDIPLGLYECPAPYKRILPAEVFKRLIETGRFIYHKDTTREVAEVKAKLAVIPANNTSFEFYDAHTPNAMYSIRSGAKGMSAIAGNFYPEILVWMCSNATDAAKQEEVEWLQSELSRVDPLIHDAYPLSAKYFLRKRGLPIRTISRAHALELTPQQKQTLDDIYNSFLGWCQRLAIEPVNVEELMMPPVHLDPPI
ncbi:MAG: dihydrodipicolinate synthetase, partial [Segetibacter sp.]|nr:dihydrodipicolinate synthetase [Segetibacter sp.]